MTYYYFVKYPPTYISDYKINRITGNFHYQDYVILHHQKSNIGFVYVIIIGTERFWSPHRASRRAFHTRAVHPHVCPKSNNLYKHKMFSYVF